MSHVMKKSNSFPTELLELNSGLPPACQPPPEQTEVSPEFKQQLEVYRETNMLCSELDSMKLSYSDPDNKPMAEMQKNSPNGTNLFWQPQQQQQNSQAFFGPQQPNNTNGGSFAGNGLNNDVAHDGGMLDGGQPIMNRPLQNHFEGVLGIGSEFQPRLSTEMMFSTTPGDTDEDMSDEVCFLMNHVDVSGHDRMAPNPEGPIMPYIL